MYDRAVSLFFDNKAKPFDAPYTEGLEIPAEYLSGLFKQAIENNPVDEDLIARFGELDEFVIEHFKTAFGNRIMKQILAFIPVYVECGGTDVEALDFLFKTKVLKKFEVLSASMTKDELALLDEELTRLFGANEFMMSRDKIAQLAKAAR